VGLERWAQLGWSVAVVLIFGPLCPEEERRIGELCRRAGFAQVSLGHEVAPSRGLHARMVTTLADAALSPLLPRAPGLYMCSDGGLAAARDAAWRGPSAVLSGPAGGVIATAALCRELGLERAFGFDMGGTSTDVCRVEGGRPGRVERLRVEGMELAVPAVALETVAAGGGSRLWMKAGALCVGPESAGSQPGPAVMGRGGPLTVTDVEALLGRLPGFPQVAGPTWDQPLDLEAGRRALEALAGEGEALELAVGMRAVAHERMASAIARLAAAEGVDPADHALVAFGGAGPGHACGVARVLGIRRVVVPAVAGACSAVGIGLARRRAEQVLPLGPEGLKEARERALLSLPFAGEVELVVVGCMAGSSARLESPWRSTQAEVEAGLRADFARRFGFARPGAPLELLELRARVEEAEERPWPRHRRAQPPAEGRSWAWFEGWREVPVVAVEAAQGLWGPALLLGDGYTVCVEAGWRVEAEEGHLQLWDEAPLRAPVGLEPSPRATAVYSGRLMGVAEQMGELLARLARSVSIRERRDYSCALFDLQGRLLVNAPHVPVHLGAMGETVRDLLRRRGPQLRPGQAWLSNDPYAGGSHLPDMTVTAPIYAEEELVGFAAVRGHHIDIGGACPGSMPPFAQHIDEEGMIFSQVLLAEGQHFLCPDLRPSRQPEELRADLEAQVATVFWGVARVSRLICEIGLPVWRAQGQHLLQRSAESVEALLRRMPGLHRAEERLDDGHRIAVELEVQGGRARLRVESAAHPGNLNAPRGVARAVLLYVFRCLVGGELPLNEGALLPFDLELEEGGLFDPRWPAAVAGGNVESSQRLADALLRALGQLAGSQGTMNNLTVGTSRGSFYETIGGGMGAGPAGPGESAVQVHMTNTRSTDPEELEHRFPVRLLRQARRWGSGGAGRHAGGDGLIKEWLFLEQASVALLAGRRREGAPGLGGGTAGLPGRDLRDGAPAPAVWSAEAGDVLRIETPGGGGWGATLPRGAPEG
jgi:5-oxoprolinase (ATP-hydrolysing)